MDGWNTSFLLGWPICRGELLVSGRVVVHLVPPTQKNPFKRWFQKMEKGERINFGMIFSMFRGQVFLFSSGILWLFLVQKRNIDFQVQSFYLFVSSPGCWFMAAEFAFFFPEQIDIDMRNGPLEVMYTEIFLGHRDVRIGTGFPHICAKRNLWVKTDGLKGKLVKGPYRVKYITLTPPKN